jgi:hypothetical protein
MAWQTAPGMIVIVGGFSLVGGLFAGIDGLRNWIYKKVCLCVCVWWVAASIYRERAGRLLTLHALPAPFSTATLIHITHFLPSPSYTPQPRHIQRDDFDFMMDKKYGVGGKKL